MLIVDGKFGLDPRFNPPPLKPIMSGEGGLRIVRLGRGIELQLGHSPIILDSLLDTRVVVDPALFRGLGSVRGGCSVFCVSNACLNWAAMNGRPRMAAKVIGVDADQPRYVLLSTPRLRGARRAQKETVANRREARLVPHVLIEPGRVECSACGGSNTGDVILEP